MGMTAARLMRSDDGPLYVALHGDYRFSALKNTASELRELDHSLRKLLVNHLKDHHLIVSGYSGRDESVMAALADAYGQPGSGRLYWCGYLEDVPNDSVSCLLDWARLHRRSAYYVPTQGFDALMTQVAQHSLSPDVLEDTKRITKDE